MDNFERIPVSSDQLMNAVRDVVKANPTHVYQVPSHGFCQYVHAEGEGSFSCGCLMGHAFNKLGVPLTELAKREGQSAGEVARDVFVIKDNISATERFLIAAQDKQDEGMPWGKALAYAENYAPMGVVL